MSKDGSFEPEWELVDGSPAATPAKYGQWLISPSSISGEVRTAIARKTYVGIDFGTSTSVVSLIALTAAGALTARTLPVEQPDEFGGTISHHLVNTVLAWRRGRLLFGREAYRLRQSLFEGRDIFSSFKMRLGVDIGPTYPETALKEGQENTVVIQDANDATREFFKCLLEAVKKAIRELSLPQEISFAVSVPASFEANQRRDLLADMAEAGLSVTESGLIDEPNAAFLSFMRESSQSPHPNQSDEFLEKLREGSANILVYDFGAGTCDISILEVDITKKPLKSRNKAISRFTALGGDDFDRAIAKNVLLPQMLAETPGFDPELRDIEERLIPRLQPTAERLKVVACEWIATKGVKTIDQMRAAPVGPFTDLPIPDFAIRGQNLSLKSPAMSLSEFADVLSPFTENYDPLISSNHVFAPVEDAIKKSGIARELLDAVLFIGGSAANPIIRAAVMENLPSSVREIVPSDLRSHVSLGASLHSLGFHAFGFDFISPITSEDIFIITRGDRREIIIPASSEVPSSERREIKCRVGEHGQKTAELPICVSSAQKILGVMKINSSTSEGFRKDEEVTIFANITHDKLLEVEAKIADKIAKTTLINPLANQEMSAIDQKMMDAKQKFNIALLKYGSRLPKAVVIAYAWAAYKAEAFETAADMFAAAERIDPSENFASTICYAYAKCGKSERSNDWARKAYQREATYITAYNLALSETGAKKELLLRESLKFKPDYIPSLSVLGNYLHANGKPEGRALLKEIVNLLEKKLDDGSIDQDDLRYLISASNALGLKELNERAKTKSDNYRLSQKRTKDLPYNIDNLVSSIDKMTLPERN
ncbi:MAG: Hsp70 family protein [Deltaproteobacteria bacterium]|jgi:molecular chaperone DnaK (HSP70)|nr:Hsp70 family protein [Deltaproteobacteria bacterium]